ncbi:MAG: hypothetical protein AB7V40_06605 [Methyloceanibacter sp.]
MSKFSIFLLAAAIVPLTAAMAEPALAGSRDDCVEGGYGLGWKGGRPYYYSPFGVKGSFDCFAGPNATRTAAKRANHRLYGDR